jgi:hypothetical protein
MCGPLFFSWLSLSAQCSPRRVVLGSGVFRDEFERLEEARQRALAVERQERRRRRAAAHEVDGFRQNGVQWSQ